MTISETILVTGAAGFIGRAVSKELLKTNTKVIGLDNLNAYYDVNLKNDRLKTLKHPNFVFYKEDLENTAAINKIFQKHKPTVVINLAAQAGVRYSLENPMAYVNSNIVGFTNILEACRHSNVKHLVYASSSSVYGGNTKMPFAVTDNVDKPISFYAASKRANELMAHTYSHLFKLPTTGLRFFTVYGPWGRPDMALFKFTKNILEDKPIEVYNNGNHQRDFTYIDDIVKGILAVAKVIPKGSEDNLAPWQLFNIGNSSPIALMTYIKQIEKTLGKKAIIKFLPMQQGDVPATYADIDSLTTATGYKPTTSVNEGIEKFVSWYKEYYALAYA